MGTLTPMLARNSTTARCPWHAAIPSGVVPSFAGVSRNETCASKLAQVSHKTQSHSSRTAVAQQSHSSHTTLKIQNRTGACSTRNRTQLTSPCRHAMYSGVAPSESLAKVRSTALPFFEPFSTISSTQARFPWSAQAKTGVVPAEVALLTSQPDDSSIIVTIARWPSKHCHSQQDS